MKTNTKSIRVAANERSLTAEFAVIVAGDDVDMTWADRAECAGRGDDLMFPTAEPGTDAHARQTVEARATCRECPVRAECLAYSLGREPWGIWGGLDEDEREALGRGQRGTALAQPQPAAPATARDAA